MTNSIKDRFAANFEKAKSTGKPRVDRIREIFQNAAAQAMAEVKEGSGEVQEIAKDTFSAISEDLGGTREGAEPSETDASVRLKALLANVINLVKRRFDRAVAWYDSTKAQAEASDSVSPHAWEQKKAEVENKVGEAGAIVANKEQQVRQHLKDLLQTAAAKL
jgi:hypothetical protein